MRADVKQRVVLPLVLALTCGAARDVVAQQKLELPATDRTAAVRATDVFGVGVIDGAAHETFANIFGVTFDEQGNLYVLDTGNHRIVVFDRAGRHLRTIGKRGGGPGEFLAPIGLAITRDGNLVVNDAARAGMQILTRGGEYLKSVPYEPGSRALVRLEPHPAGGVITETQPFDPSPRDGLPSSTGVRTVTWLPLNEQKPQPLYSMAPQPVVETQISGSGRSEGAVFAVTPPVFSPRLGWATLPDGQVAAAGSLDYRITITDHGGRPLRLLERPLTARKVSERDRERYIESAKHNRPVFITTSDSPIQRSGGGGGTPTAASLAQPVFAEKMPVINQLLADREGRIWVQRQDREGPSLIDLISADGRYLGTLQGTELPSAFGPDGLAAYIQRDDLGVQRVVVRRLSIQL